MTTNWCCWPESNWRPTDYESVALPTELQQLFLKVLINNKILAALIPSTTSKTPLLWSLYGHYESGNRKRQRAKGEF